MKNFLLIWLSLTTLTLSAQPPITANKAELARMQKYWNYRNRLQKYFVALSREKGAGLLVEELNFNEWAPTLKLL